MELLFVYGTLRRAAPRSAHSLLGLATLVGSGEFQGKLYDLGDYPGAVASDEPADVIHGDVYQLLDVGSALPQLDRYEGCGETAPAPTEYVRVIGDVRLSGGVRVRAYLYLYQRSVEGIRRIPSGDYLAWTDAPARA